MSILDDLNSVSRRIKLIDLIYTVKANARKAVGEDVLCSLRSYRNEKDKKELLENLYKKMHLNYLNNVDDYLNKIENFSPYQSTTFEKTGLSQEYKRNISSFKWHENADPIYKEEQNDADKESVQLEMIIKKLAAVDENDPKISYVRNTLKSNNTAPTDISK